jgi:hypothetical protein
LRVFVVVLAALLLAACQEERIAYNGKTVVARGWEGEAPAEGWQSVLTVRASDAEGAPPLAGSYKRRGGTIIFTPAFPPSPEVTLRITFKTPDRQIESLTIPGKVSPAGAATTVTAVYPTTDKWPANQLRFYVQFSGAMTRGVAYQHIHLIDGQGRAGRFRNPSSNSTRNSGIRR